ncbi:hypothetical protein BD770DRAFT_380878 [Pilaira anomala]|nr:hypothetical protein BD770DRAFT_380878 [Pilaira anomala]
MNKLISFIFGWMDFLIHIYIHIISTIKAVIYVANKQPTFPTEEELVLQRRRTVLVSRAKNLLSERRRSAGDEKVIVTPTLNSFDKYYGGAGGGGPKPTKSVSADKQYRSKYRSPTEIKHRSSSSVPEKRLTLKSSKSYPLQQIYNKPLQQTKKIIPVKKEIVDLPKYKMKNTSTEGISKGFISFIKNVPILYKSKPFERMPNELLLNLFSCMDSNTLYHCSTVTKHWNALITPILWKSACPKHPIMTFTTDTSSLGFISKTFRHFSPQFPFHLPKYGHAIQSLDLSRIAHSIEELTITKIIHHCPNLNSLNLSDSSIGIMELLSISKNISLKTFIAQNCEYLTDVGLLFLVKNCRHLEALDLAGCGRITDNGLIKLVIATGSSLRRINLSNCKQLTGISLHAIAKRCGPRLEWLDIDNTSMIQHSHLEYLVTRCPNITRLNLGRMKNNSLRDENRYPLNALLNLIYRLDVEPRLTDESFQHRRNLLLQQRERNNSLVSSQTIDLITCKLLKLEHLNLSGWDCMNDENAKKLALVSHRLVYLNVIGCKNLTKNLLLHFSSRIQSKFTRIDESLITDSKPVFTFPTTTATVAASI